MIQAPSPAPTHGRHFRRYTVEYRLAGRIYRKTVTAENEHRACQACAKQTGGGECRVVGREL